MDKKYLVLDSIGAMHHHLWQQMFGANDAQNS